MTILSILLASATVHTTFLYDEFMNITESCDGKFKGCLKGADKVVFYCICFNCVNSISSVNHMFCFQMRCLVLKFGQDNVLLEKKFIFRKKNHSSLLHQRTNAQTLDLWPDLSLRCVYFSLTLIRSDNMKKSILR